MLKQYEPLWKGVQIFQIVYIIYLVIFSGKNVILIVGNIYFLKIYLKFFIGLSIYYRFSKAENETPSILYALSKNPYNVNPFETVVLFRVLIRYKMCRHMYLKENFNILVFLQTFQKSSCLSKFYIACDCEINKTRTFLLALENI